MNHSLQQTICVMHYGENQVRGSEICLFHSINAMLEANYKVVLFRNNDIIDGFLPKSDMLTVLSMSYSEIMIDGPLISLPIKGYYSGLKYLLHYIKRYKPMAIFCNSGLPCQTAVPVGKLTNTKVICHFHHPAAKRYFYFWLVRYATKLIFPSQYTQSVVRNKCGRQGKVIYNAVDLDSRYAPTTLQSKKLRDELGINEKTIVIGQVAALVPHKRPDMLIKCFAEVHRRIPDTHLLIIGQGEMHQQLTSLSSTLKLDNSITITGYVKDTLPYLQQVININVLASTEEGLGISVIEAAGCELPSIVTDCTGLSEAVEHGVTGLKFERNDSKALISSMLTLVTNPDLRIQYGKAARALALQKFNLNTYKKSITSIINSLKI